MFKITRAHIVDPFLMGKPLPCNLGMSQEEVSSMIHRDEYCYTLWNNDKVVEIMGASFISGKVAYGWSYLSEEISGCKISFIKAMKKVIDEFFEVKKLNRFFVTVACTNSAAIRQNEWMGLSKEGVMRKSGLNGEDQFVLAKVRE